ncbi:MAG TPA: cupredoxin domain-containing protein [Vicinamibacterales bacterium]|nr:cupredoxin domain-containing protein [Vicinamibacterales bacterium]
MASQPIIDAAAVVGMALLTGVAFAAAPQDPATASAPREIAIVAKRFAFEPATVEVTEGERIRLSISSADGVHGFQVRRLRLNKLIPRGSQPVTIDFVAPAPGSYEILCSEECGDGHDTMTGTLIVKAK